MGSSAIKDWVILILFLGVTVGMAAGHFSLPVDVENAAMRSVGTPQAEALAKRNAAFEQHVSLMLAVSTDQGGPPAELDPWIEQLGASTLLSEMRELPSRSEGMRVWSVRIRVPESGAYGERAARLESQARELLPAGCKLLVAGQPIGETVIADELVRENKVVVPAILVVLLIALMLIYRSWKLALGGLLPAVGAVLWIGGIQSIMGLAVDPISTLLAPALLAIGVASSVHVLERFTGYRLGGSSVEQASRRAARALRSPTSLTAATTVAGFLGLMTSAMPAVHRFAYLAAMGVALACFFSLAMLPIWLRCVGPAMRHRPHYKEFFGFLADLGTGHAGWLLGVASALALLMVWGWKSLEVDTDPLNVLPIEHPFRQATTKIVEAVGAVDSFDVVFQLERNQGTPEQLAVLASSLSGDPGIVGPAGPPEHSESGWTRWSFLLVPSGTSERELCFDRAESILADSALVKPFVAGDVIQIARDSGALVRGQLSDLGVTLFLLWITMAIGFRSIRLALIGLIPNLLPCLVLYGSMAFLGKPLSVVSAMIGTVMLGVIVDDTIHMLGFIQDGMDRGLKTAAAVRKAMEDVGRAVLTTSVVLSLGFAGGLLGELETTKEFAQMAGAVVGLALLCDLILLPAAVQMFMGRGKNAAQNRSSRMTSGGAIS